VVQVVECLPRKHEALSSRPVPTKEKKGNEQKVFLRKPRDYVY
jgi:hypothetical protein